MDSNLRLTEGAGVLDVYDHEEEEEEGEGGDVNDEFDDDELDDDEYGEEVVVAGYVEEEELEDDLQEEHEKDVSFSQQEEEEEEEGNQQVDPSLLALAAAQQQDEIITEERDRTASGEIKQKVYDFLMTSKNTNKSARKIPSPPTSYRTPANFYIPPSSPENVHPPPLPPPPDRSISPLEGKEDSSPKEIPSRSGSSDASGKNYPTEFSANLIHNYDAVYRNSSSSSLFSPQPLPPPLPTAVPPRSAPDTIFPIDREVSDESIMMMAAKEEAVLVHNDSSPTPPTKRPPSTLADVLPKVNDALGGKVAMKRIDENMEAAVLKAKVQMLRDATNNLRCSHLVDIIFGDGDVPKKPPPGDLRRLKNIIAAELTLNEFIKSSEVTDINSAELFRRSNENLEMVQRQQIMSNPLFSEISAASSLFSRVRQGVAAEKEEVGAEVVAPINPDNNLHMELFNLLNSTPGQKEDPCQRLSDRVSFLNRLIHHKTANNISWTRLVNLVSSISCQATVVLFGDGDEQTIPGWTSPTTSSKLKNEASDMNMGSIGVDLLFGAASDMLKRNMSLVCVDIGELALYLNIPVVLLQWPQEFITTAEYKNILMRSISSFSAKMAIPSMYIIDQIMFDDEEDFGGEEEQHNLELFSEGDKKATINKLYNEIRSGRGREKEFMRSIFQGRQHQAMSSSSSSSSDPLDTSTAYSAAASIIDYKIPVFDKVMNGVVKYLDRRKHLINAAVIKLLKKAKLNITVYCIKNKLNNASAKKTDSEDAPMQNLMYRSSALPVAGTRSRRRGGAPASVKRPPPSILSSRIKRLKQWETTSSDESEFSDEGDP